MMVKLKTVAKGITMLGVAGALAIAAATPSQARWYHHGDAAAAGVGFAAGAAVGAAASNAYYGPAYYGPGYGAYAYEPAYTYRYQQRSPSCIGDGGYGRPDLGACQ
ncbi:MAG: hypothetical protein WBD48_15715 [Pseudolabrys sp.]